MFGAAPNWFMTGERWHQRSAETVLSELGSSLNGLSGDDVAERLAANGQQFSAERSIAALKRMAAPRLLTAASLSCIESALTGESEVTVKQSAPLAAADVPLGDRRNMVFLGTSVAAGTGQAVVVATGMTTELGRIAGLIDEAGGDEQTPLQHRLESFGQILVWAALGGELGYSLSHSFEAVFDNPDLVVACVIGDGEAETGPLATAWHSNKLLNPATDGAVLPT